MSPSDDAIKKLLASLSKDLAEETKQEVVDDPITKQEEENLEKEFEKQQQEAQALIQQQKAYLQQKYIKPEQDRQDGDSQSQIEQVKFVEFKNK